MATDIVPDVFIKVNGLPLSPTLLADLVDVQVSDTIDMASSFSLRFHAGSDPLQNLADTGPLGLGAEVEIELGYVGNRKSLITGDVVSLTASFQGGPRISVSGQDVRQRLGRGPTEGTYTNQTDSVIATKVIQRNKLTPLVEPTTEVRTQVVQSNETDLAFLLMLAKRNGYQLDADGDTLRFGPPPEVLPIPLSASADLHEFEVTVSAARVVKKMTISGKDSITGDKFDESSETRLTWPGTVPVVDRLFPTSEVLSGPGAVARSAAEAKAMAQARHDETVKGMLTGRGRMPGDTRIRAGALLKITDLGTRASGSYRVVSASHSYSGARGYSTSFEVAWSPK